MGPACAQAALAFAKTGGQESPFNIPEAQLERAIARNERQKIEKIKKDLDGLQVWSSRVCTRHEPGWFSHRKDATNSRMASVVWIP